jgi:hypothetical protein
MRPLRGVFALLGVLAALLLPVQRASAIVPAAVSVAASVAATAPLDALSPGEALETLLRTVAQRVVQATRDVAPGLADRIDALLERRRGQADAPPVSGARRTGSALLQVSGVSIIGLVIALVVLVTALGPLEGIIRTAEADVSGAFWRGLVAQLIALPALGLAILGLALTVVGLLLVPIVLLAATLGIAGVGTLGLLSVAAVIGRARARDDAARSRARLLRALLTGYALIWLPWLLAALTVAVPVLGLTTRIIALASSWVVVTVGVGAVVWSRGGLRVPEPMRPITSGAAAAAQPDWSTPTPVGGVVAARRPQ